MKKLLSWLFILILSIIVFLLGFNNKKNILPNYLYQVYLDDQVLGVIKNKEELINYIDLQGHNIKKKYGVTKVEAPDGLNIKKVVTYHNEVDSIKDIYNKINKLKPFTIQGYEFTLKKEIEDENGEEKTDNKIIFVTDENVFKESIEKTIVAFIGEDNYEQYKNKTQKEIDETGTYYNSIYIDNIITRKKVNISLNEKIYKDTDSLSQYLLFSSNENKKEYIVNEGDTIKSVSDANKIGVQEFLVSNPEFTSEDNMLYPGQKVYVSYANPLVDVMAQTTKVSDQDQFYSVEERPSDNILLGNEEIVQNGENGINRVTQEVIMRNGNIINATTKETTTIKPATNKIVNVGTKYVSGVGGNYWSWPTAPGWSISQYAGQWLTGTQHRGLDIIGPGEGSPIYAANNGVVIKVSYYQFGSYGICIIINHNNGYTTLYGHLSGVAAGIKVGDAVDRGQLIGYMGNTGYSFGTHLHFELMPGSNYSNTFLDPLILY